MPRPSRNILVPQIREFPDCPKCLQWNPYIEYIYNFDGLIKCIKTCYDVEHFHITCSRCGYMWSEKLRK